jgi:hypothetical protein
MKIAEALKVIMTPHAFYCFIRHRFALLAQVTHITTARVKKRYTSNGLTWRLICLYSMDTYYYMNHRRQRGSTLNFFCRGLRTCVIKYPKRS